MIDSTADIAANDLPDPGLISVVIPAWNEAETMSELLRRIREALAAVACEIEIIVIVPDPDDPTFDAAEQGGAKGLVQKRPGYGGALKEGLLAARGEFVVTMDADMSHPPEAIPAILARRGEAEVIIGSRYVAGGSAKLEGSRAFLSPLLNLIYRRILAVPVMDMSSGFRVYHRKILQEMSLEGEKYDILEEILVKAYSLGWKVLEVPFDYQLRLAGESHASVVSFTPHFIATLVRLWLMRNTYHSADYDSRAYDSLVLPQRYWQRKRHKLVKELAGSQQPKLDIGCGSSRIIQSEPETLGLDIEIAKLRFLRRTNPRLICADCVALPFADSSFETVVNSQLIEHLPYDRRMFSEMNRVLKKGGTLVIGTPDYGRLAWRVTEWFYKRLLPYGYGDDHLTQYTRYRLTEELAQAGFAIVSHRYVFGGELIIRCVKREECGVAAGG